MKLNYKFSNLLGTVYRKGNVCFTPDGSTVISPVGNKVTVFNLTENKTETLPIESRLNVTVVAINPAGTHLLLVNEAGEALYVSLISKTILHRHRFNKPVRDVRFSRDGRQIAVCRDTDVQLFKAPGVFTHQYNPFYLETVFKVSHDSSLCLDWSVDSRLLAVGCADMQTKVCAATRLVNARMCAVGGHTAAVVAVFFTQSNYDIFTIDQRGFVVTWEANLVPGQLTEGDFQKEKVEGVDVLTYKKLKRYSYHEIVTGPRSRVTSAAYHVEKQLLVTGFEVGAFVLHEMPEFNLIHNLSVSDHQVQTIAINKTADWIALGCGANSLGQLLVWEWQSESYVMKQQGHARNPQCLAYSPDGALVVTGADDGKVKVWSTSTGLCTVTFSEHRAGVTGVCWTQGGKAVVSSSLDGTVRACDLKRYRNFRTLTTPRPVQLSCVCVDSSGEVVCSGALDAFDVYVWSLQNGRLLEILSGHDAPVAAVCFNSAHPILASVSWDKTLRIWEVYTSSTAVEILQLQHEAMDVQFTRDGRFVGAVLMNSEVKWFAWKDNVEVGCIEAKPDLDPGRANTDVVTAQTSGKSKSLTCFDHSTDGEYVITGGQSKFVCIYHRKEQMLLRKFQITCNLSLDSVADDLDRRQFSEFGSLKLIDGGSGDEQGGTAIKLPGVRSGDNSQRSYRPEIRVTAVRFSPTGRSWAACTTEGLLIYSLDETLLFNPFQLEGDINVATARKAIDSGDHGNGVIMALKLNQTELIREALEATPVAQVSIICRMMHLAFVEKLLTWLASPDGLQHSRHLEFYLIWVQQLLYHHASDLKPRDAVNLDTWTSLQQVLSSKRSILGRICEHNKYTVEYLLSMHENMDRLKHLTETKIDVAK